MSKVITEQDIIKASQIIGCEVAAIKAVHSVESKGSGFMANGMPLILFEPHIFWKELRKRGITPVESDICYPTWGTQPYGKYTDQPNRLERASKIHREAALMSCSWGLFQIMGFNYKLAGCDTLQEFINRNYESEGEQLKLFVNYIKSALLDDELIRKDWKGFALGYNGPLYWKNQYDSKLKKAFEKNSIK